MMNLQQFAILGIGGVTNGGKTTLSSRLLEKLPNVHVLNMDNYYWPEDSVHHVVLPEFNNYADYEVPTSVDFVRLLADTEKWIEKVQSRPPGGATHILLIEGILIYNFGPLQKYFHKKYFFTLSKEECWKRRRQRCYYPPDPEGYFDEIVWPRYLDNSASVQHNNDIGYLDGNEDTDATFEKVLTDLKSLLKH